MPQIKRLASVLLSWSPLIVQIVFASVFGGAQFIRMLDTTQGVNMTWFIYWEAFLILNLVMAMNAHKNQPSHVTLQTLLIYASWTLVVTLDLIVVVFNSVWDKIDTETTIFVVIGIAFTALLVQWKKLSLNDPAIKMCLAIVFKFVPQMTLAHKILEVGGAGLSGITLLNGHITICIRIIQAFYSMREFGKDRNRIGILASEISNEVSWLVVTIVWLFQFA